MAECKDTRGRTGAPLRFGAGTRLQTAGALLRSVPTTQPLTPLKVAVSTENHASPTRERGTQEQASHEGCVQRSCPSLARFEVALFDSPGGATGSSRGREPPEKSRVGYKSPKGATANRAFVSLSPLRATL